MKQFKKGGNLSRFDRGPPNIGDKPCRGDSGFIQIIGTDNTPFYFNFDLHALKHLDGCQEWANVERDAMDKEYNEMKNCSDLILLRNVVEELLNKMKLYDGVETKAVEYDYSSSHGWMLRRHGVCLFYNACDITKPRLAQRFQLLPGYKGLSKSYVIHIVSIFCCDDHFNYNGEKILRADALPIKTTKIKKATKTVQADMQDHESDEIKDLKSILQQLKREVEVIENKIKLEQVIQNNKGELVKQLEETQAVLNKKKDELDRLNKKK